MRPNALPLPSLSFLAIPNIPNYRLGPREGSPCDTLGITALGEPPPEGYGHRVYPNPVRDAFTLELDEGLQHAEAWFVTVKDISGRLVYRGRLPAYAYIHRVETQDWMTGVYLYTVAEQSGRVVATGKVVKVE